MRQPYFSKVRKCWYVREGTTQINLGKDKEEAFKKFHTLAAGQHAAPSSVTAAEVIAQYLDWSKANQAPATYKHYTRQMKSFAAYLGNFIKCRDLKPYHVHRWVDKNRWTGNTANNAVRAAVRSFSWAAQLGVIPHNPLPAVKRPPATPRECYITDEQYQVFLKETHDQEFLDLSEFLWETGCRPLEARRIEARHFDRGAGVITFPRVESKGKKKRRSIVLNAKAKGIIQRLVLKHPDGLLFRNIYGRPWGQSALVSRFRNIRLKTGIEITAYAFRHTWITNALLRGVEPLTVATLAGHSNIEMVWKVYQHIQLQSGHMKASAEQATRKQA